MFLVELLGGTWLVQCMAVLVGTYPLPWFNGAFSCPFVFWPV